MPARERTYRTEAIVLRRKDVGEADRLLTLLTPERGKMRVLAKGIRKPCSRKAGHLELFTCVRLLIACGHGLDIVTQAESKLVYRPLREDLLRGAYAAYAVELLDRFTPEAQENRELYRLLRMALGWFSESAELELSARYYELRLLALAGFQPQLHRCVAGGETIIAQDQFFSAGEGGVVCPECGARHAGVIPASTNALRYLRYFQTHSYAEALATAPRIPRGTRREMEHLLATYIVHLLERRLKSKEFLELIRRQHTDI